MASSGTLIDRVLRILSGDPTTALGAATKQYVDNGQLYAFRNKFINGNFDFWQRSTSTSASSAATYCADRWLTGGTGSTVACSQQTFPFGQTVVPNNPRYFLRCVVNSVSGASNNAVLAQRIEFPDTFAGQTVTVSFWAKADSAKTLAITFSQNFGTGGSAPVAINATSATAITTSWALCTYTVNIPSVSGKTNGVGGMLGMYIYLDAGSSITVAAGIGQKSGTWDFSQFQIEANTKATTFEQRTYGLELSLCQRYYWKTFDQAISPVQNSGTYIGAFGYVASFMGGGYVGTRIQYPSRMRAAPTITFYNPAAANSNWRNRGANADSGSSSTAYSEVGDSSCIIVNSQITADMLGQTIYVHISADAEL